MFIAFFVDNLGLKFVFNDEISVVQLVFGKINIFYEH